MFLKKKSYKTINALFEEWKERHNGIIFPKQINIISTTIIVKSPLVSHQRHKRGFLE